MEYNGGNKARLAYADLSIYHRTTQQMGFIVLILKTNIKMEREQFKLTSLEITDKNELKYSAEIEIINSDTETTVIKKIKECNPNMLHDDAFDALSHFFTPVKKILDITEQIGFCWFKNSKKGIKFKGKVLKTNRAYYFETTEINLSGNLYGVEAEMKAYLEVFEDEIFKYIFENKTGGEIAEIE